MTRKEAKKIIQRIYVPDGNGDVLGITEGETLFGDDVEEALDMAIEALEQQKEERGLYDAVNSILNKLMDDTWNNRYPHYELIKGYCLEVLKLIELGVKGGE